jgi:hypothetical protein
MPRDDVKTRPEHPKDMGARAALRNKSSHEGTKGRGAPYDNHTKLNKDFYHYSRKGGSQSPEGGH